MRTIITSRLAAGRNELVAILVPLGQRPPVPEGAPPAASWRDGLADEKEASFLLTGGGGARWLFLRVPRRRERQRDDLRCAAARARLEAEKLQRAGLTLDLTLVRPRAEELQAAVEGANMAAYDPAVLKKERKKPVVRRISLAGLPEEASMRTAVRLGRIAGEANLFTRDLQNLPANLLTPAEFASRARKVCAGSARLRCKVLRPRQMEELGMGALLGVARGSSNEPRLVHMVHRPTGRSRGRVAVVGKGLCFDSGGISLKPSAKMDEMKFDMSGAAAVLGLFHALAAGAPCPWEVHGILACVENMPGGRAQRPGDIVRAMNGTTIEVLNTDAEGRLVLADALCYADRKVQPEWILDLATLTGAAIVALGHNATAILGNDDGLLEQVRKAGEQADERCWPLPLWEVHKELIRGSYADLKNIYSPGEGAGTIAGAAFLSHFVGDRPWVHLDIAATAWEGPARPYFTRGGRGVGVRLLLQHLQ